MNTDDTLSHILRMCKKVTARRNQSDRVAYQTFCPAHEDKKSMSLSISQTYEGKLKLYCHAGCSFGSICDAFGILQSDCFPKEQGRERSWRQAANKRPFKAILDDADYTLTLAYNILNCARKGEMTPNEAILKLGQCAQKIHKLKQEL